MNIAWHGPTDLTFHRLTRSKILEQLDWLRKNSGDYKTSEIFRLDRFGNKQPIIRVKEKDNGVFVCTLGLSGSDAQTCLDLWEKLGSPLEALDFETVASLLETCTNETVWLTETSCRNPTTVIGKIMSVNTGGHLAVSLIPVPVEIEQINEDVRLKCAARGCTKAADGLLCGACEKLSDCKIINEVNTEIIKEHETK